MSINICQLTEEQLLCCICLDVFTDPVTLPCGHNFCKRCITQHLNFNSQRQCPVCKKPADGRHEFGVNKFISEVAVQFRKSTGRKTGSAQQLATPGNACYDVPAGSKRVPLKSCLLLAFSLMGLSFYFAHTLLHANMCFCPTAPILKTPQVFEEEVDTKRTEQPLQLFCKDEQICRPCVDSSHELPHVVPSKVKRAGLDANIHRMIQERRAKIQELKHSTKLSNEAADRETKHGGQVFQSLVRSLEKAKAELLGMIDGKQEATENRARSYVQELEEEISELMRIRVKVQKLPRSKNLFDLLQSSSFLNEDRTEVSICPAAYKGLLRTAMVKAVTELTETFRAEMEKMKDAEMKNIQRVDVTLDPDTAHPALVLSADGKQVHCGDVWKELPENPKRFYPAINVLGRQSFSCGRFYYDVQVKGKTGWTLGVANGSVNRKGEVQLNPENGYWTIRRRNQKEYVALASYPVHLPVTSHPEEVRVFVDYEEGLVSFYDVDAEDLLYSFTEGSFTERLYPFFSPGTSDDDGNSAPLIISSISSQ